MRRRVVVSWCCVVVSVMSSAAVAQVPSREVSAGLIASGPTRGGAEYLHIGASHIVAQSSFASLALDAGALLRYKGERASVVCAAVTGPPALSCDTRELSHVGRLGLTARVTPFGGESPYLVASAGGWQSRWQDGERSALSTATPYGGVVDLGVGVPVPGGDRRTMLEVRYGVFRQADAGGRTPVRGGSVRLAVHRRW